MLYTEGLDKVKCPNFERRAASGFSAFEEAALIRDYLLGLRPTPTREEILEINGTGQLSCAFRSERRWIMPKWRSLPRMI
jgi:hypothetical protein